MRTVLNSTILFLLIGTNLFAGINRFTADTLTIDESFELLYLYLYNSKNGDDYRFDYGQGIVREVKTNLPFTGNVKLLRENGDIYIFSFIKGIPSGTWRKYNRKGQIEYEVPLKDGFFHGTVISYFLVDGINYIHTQGEYNNGYPDGLFLEYSSHDYKYFLKDSARLKTNYLIPRVAILPYQSYFKESGNYGGGNVRRSPSGYHVSPVSLVSEAEEISPRGGFIILYLTECFNTEYNPLPVVQVTVDGLFVRREMESVYNRPISGYELDRDDRIILKAYWENGKCIWQEKYEVIMGPTYKYINPMIEQVKYQYYPGYYTETKQTLNELYNSYHVPNVTFSANSDERKSYNIDTFAIIDEFLVNGYRHGEFKGFETKNSRSISAPESKFFIDYNYMEGTYYLGTPTGEWNYFVVDGTQKYLVATVNYSKNTPEMREYGAFQIGTGNKKLCGGIDTRDPVRDGVTMFYSIPDASPIIGYRYSNDRVVELIKK